MTRYLRELVVEILSDPLDRAIVAGVVALLVTYALMLGIDVVARSLGVPL